MTLSVVLAGLIAVCCGNEIYTNPGDNSHYVEGESRYIWFPDSQGVPHLVDLQAPIEDNSLKYRNGANNEYWLFTRDNPHDHQLIIHGDAYTIEASNYLSSRPVKVIVHGWYGNGSDAVNTLIKTAFLTAQDCNVIVVDWNASATTYYTTAAAAVPDVGQHLGNFLIWLIETTGGNWNDVHLVGFSLGAHVVGNAGRTANGRPAHITGLDPAAPGWIYNKKALDISAGRFLEVIHTDAGMCGILNPIGHADFYPNGGKNPQPGCRFNACSHQRAPELFAATIYYNHLAGRQCSNVREAELLSCSGEFMDMGTAFTSKRGNGIYALKTGNTWPF